MTILRALTVTLYTIGIMTLGGVTERARRRVHGRPALSGLSASEPARDPERGSVTMEQVLWAVAVIAIVGIVVAAIRAYVTAQAGNIN